MGKWLRFQYNTYVEKGLGNLVLALNGVDLGLAQMFERFALNDLNKNALSNLTAYHLDDRLLNDKYYSGMSVIEAQWSPGDNTFTCFFEMEPTKGTPTTVLTPSAKEYKGSFYNVVFQFQDSNKWLGEREEFEALQPTDQVAKLKEMIWKAEAKLHSNDPSFYYQGMWEDLAGLDGTIFGFPGPKGDGKWRARHAKSGGLTVPEIRITKHMAQVIDQFDKMISEIRDKTRIV